MNNAFPYQQLKIRAVSRNDEVDSAQKYQRAYRFYESADEENDSVLLINSGCQISLEDYLLTADPTDTPVDVDFETGEVK